MPYSGFRFGRAPRYVPTHRKAYRGGDGGHAKFVGSYAKFVESLKRASEPNLVPGDFGGGLMYRLLFEETEQAAHQLLARLRDSVGTWEAVL